jgi:phosphoribosyl 1,2-cyclic phosphate phosphodiesterase
VLIDCGPDFRQQTTRFPFTKLDAVVISHIHFDHVAGIDDLRPYCKFGDVDIYCQDDVVKALHQTMPYCFKENLYPGVPHLNLHAIAPHETFTIRRDNEVIANFPPSGSNLAGVINKEGRTISVPPATDTLQITPIQVMHGNMPILGYIFREQTNTHQPSPNTQSIAYITDMKSIEDSEYEYLHDIDTLVINALRFEKPHHSHQLVDDAIAVSRRIGAKRTYLIHLTHDIGTHEIANSRLPECFEFAYDGQIIEC